MAAITLVMAAITLVMAAILAAGHTQQLLKTKIPAVVLD
jgi:hypothetical protein